MFLSLAALAAHTIAVRTAHFDVTPPVALPLGGYTERKGTSFEPGGSELWIRILTLDDVVIVAWDTLTIPEGFYQAVQDRFPQKKIVLIATHTHCAPDSQMLNPRMTFSVPGIAHYEPRWFKWYAAKVTQAIEDTLDLPPVHLGQLDLTMATVKLNHGRRAGAVPDQTAWVLGAGHPLLAAYAAHPTFHDSDWLRLDGDWPGALAQRLGALVVTGAIGDVGPEAPGKQAVEKCSSFVEKFVTAIQGKRSRAVWKTGKAFAFEREPIVLDKDVPHPAFAKTYGIPEQLAQVLVDKFAEPKASLTLIRLGSLLVVGVPGEPSAALGRAIQAAARKESFPHCLVLSHVNGWIGYILLPDDYDRGGYEATLSFNGRQTAIRVLEALKRGVARLRAKP